MTAFLFANTRVDLNKQLAESLSGSITKPYITGSIGKAGSNEHTTFNYLRKNKKACVVGKDDKRFQKYLKDFEYLLEEKRHMLHLIK